MAAISTALLNPNPSFNYNHHSKISLQAQRVSPIKIRSIKRSVLGGPVCETRSFDVVVVGAGIIGLSIARQILVHSNLSVAVVDSAVPCSGATGAGQGYLWMAPKQPGTGVWDLALRSQKLWQLLADTVQDEGIDPLEAFGWKKTGSLLIGRTEAELNELKRQVQVLSEAGVRAEYLSGKDLALQEPELGVDQKAGGAFVPDDCQLDAYRTVSYIEKGNRLFAPQGRYGEFFNDPAVCFIRSNGNGKIEGIRTKKNAIYGLKAIVVAAGCWTGSLMHELLRGSDIVMDVPVKPRKGFLLVLENFKSLRLNHGLMEAGYINHKESVISAPGKVDHEGALSISMTATVDVHGNLLIGSSRQFSGFNTELDPFIVNCIWERAQDFFPAFKDFSLEDLSEKMNVRIGLRPYMPDGRPVIGPVPGMSNVILATGHEGGGLCMALGTAEMVTDMILENPLHIDCKHFAVEGRCC